MFLKNYTERLWGRKASEISADWGAQRVKGVSINAIIKDMFNKLFGIKHRNIFDRTILVSKVWTRSIVGNISYKNREKRWKNPKGI